MPVVLPLLAVFVAILCVLAIYTARPFFDFVGRLFGKIPVVGGHIESFLVKAGDVTYVLAKTFLAKYVSPVVSFIATPIIRFVVFIGSIISAIEETAHTLPWLIGNELPRAFQKVQGWITGVARAASAYALKLYHSAIGYALKLYHSSTKYALHLYDVVRAYALAEVKAARTYALHLYHAAESYALREVQAVERTVEAYARTLVGTVAKELSTLEGTVRALEGSTARLVQSSVGKAISTAENAAEAASAAALGKAESAVVGAVDGLWSGVITDVGKLQDVIATDLPDIGAAIRAIPRVIPRDLAGAITGVLALAIPAIRYMEEGGVPNCRNLSKYGRDLQDLLGAMATGGLFAFLAAMVEDPAGTARDVDSALGPVVTDAGDAAKSLLGVG